MTDQVIEKMLAGGADPRASTDSSGDLVKKLIRELEAKGVSLEEFVKEEGEARGSHLSYEKPASPKRERAREVAKE